jgi:hypothetical protein
MSAGRRGSGGHGLHAGDLHATYGGRLAATHLDELALAAI